ncbi:putative MFS family arabinose efflux permease [Planifilum fimeticola]|uniref:Putative MFS family arabinose efflux permease n=2 Tax=Planifilum fimeticola TaxID=201975 RepID=A0A2T0LIP0_9BACL|nr:putative MFS family arabinose efflux permease [Planifilum fimeticola]
MRRTGTGSAERGGEMRERLWTKDFILICAVNFFMFAGFFMLLPTLPIFVVDELGESESQAGLVVGVFTVAAVLTRPASGIWLDRWGRRHIMILSLALFAVASSSYLAAFSMVFLLLLRLFHGAVFGMSTTAAATAAADQVPSSRRGEGLGIFGISSMLAMILSPALGMALLQHGSYSLVFLVGAGLATLALLFALPIRHPEAQARSGEEGRGLKRWIEMRAVPYSVSLVGPAIVFGGVVSFISLYAIELGNPGMAGGYFVVYALALVLSRMVSGKIYDRKGPDSAVIPGFLLYLAGMVALGLADGPVLFYAGAGLIGFGYGAIQPSVQALVIAGVPAERRGAATATYLTAMDAGIGLGSFVLGLFVGWWGYRSMFLIGGLFVLASMFVYRWARTLSREREGERKTA